MFLSSPFADRTKDLLFRGAKKSVTSIVEVSHSNATLKGTCHTALNCGPSLKQMQLTPEGQLSCSKESHVSAMSHQPYHTETYNTFVIC